MKHLLFNLLMVAIFIPLSGQGQNLVVGSSDAIGYPEKAPSSSFLLESDQDHFFRISASFNDAPVHPLLSNLDDQMGSLFFIQYNKHGEALIFNYLKGTSYAKKAFSYEGGLQLFGNGYNDIDANGQAVLLNKADYLEFLASYDRNLNLQIIKSIWDLNPTVYPSSEAEIDSRDGSIYIYGTTNEDILEVNGFGPIGMDWMGDYIYVLKFNKELDLKWVYTAGFNTDTTSGYFPSVDLRVIPGYNGSVLITGTYYSNSSMPVFGSDHLPYTGNGQGVFIAALDNSGRQTWVQSGENQNWENSSRIEKGFSFSNGDYLLAGATSTGYFKIGKTEFIFDGGSGYQNQFIFRIGPDGSVRWSKPLQTMGASFKKKKGTSVKTLLKGAGSEDMISEIYNDAYLWNEEVLYVIGTYLDPSFVLAGKPLPVTHGDQFFIASIDPENGNEWWGYGVSSGWIQLQGFDVDRTGHVYLMGRSTEKQDYNGNEQVIGPASRMVFHMGLDYRGRLLWYNNAFLPSNVFDVSGSDLEVLPYGEVFSSLRITAPENLDIGSQSLQADFNYTNWLVGLKATMELSGEVKDEAGQAVFPGYVRAYRSAPARAYPVIDSVPLSDAGSYIFKNLYPGHYTLQVVPDRTKYPESVPSYLGDEFAWTGAQFQDFGPDERNSTLFISVPTVPALTPAEGSGTISGNVSYKGQLKSTLGRPVKKASVMLLKKSKKSTNASGDLVGYFETDDLGNYTFENVPDGDYILIVDITGLSMIQVYEVTITGNQIVSGLDYEVGTDGIAKSWGVGMKSAGYNDIRVFPNPGDGKVLIAFETPGDYQIKVYAADGRLVSSSHIDSVAGQLSLDLREQEPGIYLILIEGPDTCSSLKYLKR